MNDLSSTKDIYGLGLVPRTTFSNSLKKTLFSFLKKTENRLPFPFNRGLNYLCSRIRFKSISSLHYNELQNIVSFLERNLNPGKYFALYSEGGSGYQIAKQLKNTSVGDRIWAHYDANHREFNTFNRADAWVGIDHSYAPVDFNLFLSASNQYDIAVRRWKFDYNSPWKIILPFYKSATLYLKEWENSTPTLLWVMQFAGAARLGPTFDDLATYFQRKPLKYSGLHSFTTRSIANLKSSFSTSAPLGIQHHMGQEKHLYNAPEKDELSELLHLVTKRLPYGSWTSVHEFIDFAKLASIKDLQSVVLVRDPRDMIVSAFFRCGYDPRNLPEEHPNNYIKKGISTLLDKFSLESFKEESLLCLAAGGTFGMCPTYYVNWPSIKDLAQSFLAAKKCPNAFIIKFEDIRSNPKQAYRLLVEWLNWNPRNPISEERLEKAIFYGTFDFQTGGKVKEGMQANFTNFDTKTGHAISARKGISGDWKNHFSKRVKDYVKGQIGNELIELGYEKDLDW